MPSLSVVICTRDRGRLVVDSVRSVLASEGIDVELLVVDQSAGPETAQALESVADPRLMLLRSPTISGLSRARNLGLEAASRPIVAMTDDDCEVDRSWGAQMLRAFAQDSRIALVFGDVRSGPHDASAGFVPAYRCDRPFLAVSLEQKMQVEGMGACMAVRRDVALQLGGFDPALGAGTPTRAGEDVDFTIRVLAAGYSVYETPGARVVHHGFRSYAVAREHTVSYWTGAGCAIGKHLPRAWAVRLLARLALRSITGRSRVAASFGPALVERARLVAFARGLSRGWRMAIASRRRGTSDAIG